MRFWRIYKTFLWWCKTHKPPPRRPSPTVADPNPHLYDPLTLLAIPFNSNDVINLPVQSEPHIKNVVFPTVFRFQDRSQIIWLFSECLGHGSLGQGCWWVFRHKMRQNHTTSITRCTILLKMFVPQNTISSLSKKLNCDDSSLLRSLEKVYL